MEGCQHLSSTLSTDVNFSNIFISLKWLTWNLENCIDKRKSFSSFVVFQQLYYRINLGTQAIELDVSFKVLKWKPWPAFKINY